MNKLTKRFKVVHEGTKMVLPLTEQGDNAEVFPAATATAVELTHTMKPRLMWMSMV